MNNKYLKSLFVALSLIISTYSNATLIYDADVTNNVIMGTGVSNGSFTVVQDNGIELGLRGKLRHNSAGAAENTYNSNGDGTYTFDAGIAPTQSSNTAVWSFEWSINSDYEEITGANLDDYLFEISVDSDPTAAVNLITFDLFSSYFDHAIGTNTTGNGSGVKAADGNEFTSLISENNLAQNSWKPHWFIIPFDPTIDGTYDISISARSIDATLDPKLLAMNTIQVIVGKGATSVPEPSTLAILTLGIIGLASRKQKS